MTVLRMEHIGLVVEDLDAATAYLLCYLRGPAGIIVELAERLTEDRDG